MSEIRIGADLFPSPQLEMTCLRFSHVSSPLWHWNMCEMSSVGCPQSLGHAVEGHYPLVAMTLPVGISLDASLASHLRCLQGAFFVAIFSASQSTWE